MLVLTNYLTILVFLLFPTLTLVYSKTPGVAIHILAVLSILYLITERQNAKHRINYFIKSYWLICLATFIPLLYNVILSFVQGGYSPFPSSLQRLALFSLALFLLVDLKIINKISIQVGLLIACVTALIVMLWASNYGVIRPDIKVHNLLNYTNFIVLLGIFSLFLIRIPLSEYTKTETFIKLLCFLCVVYSVYLSKSKGPFLSLILLTLFFVYIQTKGTSILNKAIIILVTVSVPLVIIMNDKDFSKRMQQAFQATTKVIKNDESKNKAGDPSTRIRLNLWKASYLMFKENPLFGDSRSTFSEKLISLNQQNKINDEATWRSKDTAFVQPHNEFASTASSKGLFGIFILLLLYIVPIRYYLKQKNISNTIYTLSNMGISINLGFILFGLTVSTFTTGWMTAIFALFHCMIISLIHHEKQNI